MAKRTQQFPAPHNVRLTVAPEQVLAYFDVEIDENNKCLCPFHPDHDPSMQVNADYVYCYGCKVSFDTWFARKLLEQREPSLFC
jgi:hypothetical protein